jgi:CRP-like cAMP-binding protein
MAVDVTWQIARLDPICHVGMFIEALAFGSTNINQLRVLLLVAQLLLGVYGFISTYNVLDCDFVWAIVHISVNGYQLLRSLKEYASASRLEEVDRLIYDNKIEKGVKFSEVLSPLDFKSILDLSDKTREGEHLRTIDAGTVIYLDGQIGKYLMYIVSGEADVLKGEEKVNVITASKFIGELAFFTGNASTASIKATTEMVVIRWEIDKLKKLIKQGGSSIRAQALNKFPTLLIQQMTESTNVLTNEIVSERRETERVRRESQNQRQLMKEFVKSGMTKADLFDSEAPDDSGMTPSLRNNRVMPVTSGNGPRSKLMSSRFTRSKKAAKSGALGASATNSKGASFAGLAMAIKTMLSSPALSGRSLPMQNIQQVAVQPKSLGLGRQISRLGSGKNSAQKRSPKLISRLLGLGRGHSSKSLVEKSTSLKLPAPPNTANNSAQSSRATTPRKRGHDRDSEEEGGDGNVSAKGTKPTLVRGNSTGFGRAEARLVNSQVQADIARIARAQAATERAQKDAASRGEVVGRGAMDVSNLSALGAMRDRASSFTGSKLKARAGSFVKKKSMNRSSSFKHSSFKDKEKAAKDKREQERGSKTRSRRADSFAIRGALLQGGISNVSRSRAASRTGSFMGVSGVTSSHANSHANSTAHSKTGSRKEWSNFSSKTGSRKEQWSNSSSKTASHKDGGGGGWGSKTGSYKSGGWGSKTGSSKSDASSKGFASKASSFAWSRNQSRANSRANSRQSNSRTGSRVGSRHPSRCNTPVHTKHLKNPQFNWGVDAGKSPLVQAEGFASDYPNLIPKPSTNPADTSRGENGEASILAAQPTSPQIFIGGQLVALADDDLELYGHELGMANGGGGGGAKNKAEVKEEGEVVRAEKTLTSTPSMQSMGMEPVQAVDNTPLDSRIGQQQLPGGRLGGDGGGSFPASEGPEEEMGSAERTAKGVSLGRAAAAGPTAQIPLRVVANSGPPLMTNLNLGTKGPRGPLISNFANARF